MTPTPLRQRTATVVLIIVTLLVLAGCAPGAQLTSPVGVWEATGDDNGTLTINADATFTITNSSYNLVQKRDADNSFNGSGTWQLIRDDTELVLFLDEASQGDFAVEPVSIGVEFASGRMRFFHPEETASIEFRLTETEPSS